MRRYHLVIVAALVGAIATCLMIRTPDASASSESVTYIRPQVEDRPSLLVAQAEAPEAEAAPAVENSAPPDDPIEAAPKEQKAMKEPFVQSPKVSRKAAGVKAKKSSKSKAKKTAKHPKKKKKKAKKA